MSYYYSNQQQGGSYPASKYREDSATVNVGNSGGGGEQPRWSWCSTGWACCILTFCGQFPCGLLGLLFSSFAYADHKSGDFERSAYKKKCAWGWTGCGIFCGVIGLVIILLAILAFAVGITALSSVFGNIFSMIPNLNLPRIGNTNTTTTA